MPVIIYSDVAVLLPNNPPHSQESHRPLVPLWRHDNESRSRIRVLALECPAAAANTSACRGRLTQTLQKRAWSVVSQHARPAQTPARPLRLTPDTTGCLCCSVWSWRGSWDRPRFTANAVEYYVIVKDVKSIRPKFIINDAFRATQLWIRECFDGNCKVAVKLHRLILLA